MSHRVVATAGHVDHGKSTLLRALTGMEPDRLEDERRRGLSIELGFVWTTFDDGPEPITVAFVDVPGHERFVTTMLAGTGPVPAVLFVVAADDGWSRQSQEHLEVLDLLGVPAVGVAVTKADLVDADRLERVRDDVAVRLVGTSLDGAPIVAVDGVSGRALAELRATITSRLAVLPEPVDRGRSRLWVDRSFTVAGAGTVVTGTLVDGSLEAGQQLRVLPQDRRVRVRGLQSLGRTVTRADAGERVAVNLSGIDHHQLARGDVVVAEVPWMVTDTVDVWVHAVHEVDRTGAWHVHTGSAHHAARLVPLGDPLGGDGPDSGSVRIHLAEALPLNVGDRLVLRDTGRRVVAAGGVVVDPSPRRSRRRRAERVQAHARIAERPEEAAQPLLRLWGGFAPVDDLLAAIGATATSELGDGIEVVGSHAVDRTLVDRWVQALTGLGAGTHDRDQVSRVIWSTGIPRALARTAVDHLTELRKLVRTSGGWSLPEHADTAALARQRRLDALLADLEEQGLTPGDLTELAARHGVDHRGIAELTQSGAIVRCGDVVFARSAIDRAAQALRALATESGPFTAADAKNAWGTTRKFAIPLLEHFERTGLTRFDGQHHRVVG